MSKNKIFAQQEIAPIIVPSNGADSPFLVVPPLKAHPRRKLFETSYDIALFSVFIAMGIALNMFSAMMPKLDLFGRCSFIYAFCILCGVFLGAVRGGLCAAAADMIAAFVFAENGQPFMPLISISNFFMAFIPAVVLKITKNRINLTLVVSAIISFAVCTLGFSALGETLLYCYLGSKPFYPSITALNAAGVPVFFAFVVRKAITQPFWIILNLLIAKTLISSASISNALRTNRES